MSLSASRDVARSICEALDMLRRPGHESGRDFLLETGTDPLGDLSLLSSPEVVINARPGKMELEFLLPVAADDGDVSPPRLEVTTTLAQRRIVYSVGRFVQCEATGESLFALWPCAGDNDAKGRAAALTYTRVDSPGCRFQVYAITRPGVTMHQIYDDYERAEQAALYGNFTYLTKGFPIAANGCPQCGGTVGGVCSCDLTPTVPTSSFDFRHILPTADTITNSWSLLAYTTRIRRFSAVAYNLQQLFGSFRIVPVSYSLDLQTEETDHGNTMFGSARRAAPPRFSKEYRQFYGPPRPLPLPRGTVHYGDNASNRGPRITHMPVAPNVCDEVGRTVFDLTARHGPQLHESARQVLGTGGTNQGMHATLQHTEGRDRQYPADDAAFNMATAAVEEAGPAAAPGNVGNCLGACEGSSTFLHAAETRQNPTEVRSGSPAYFPSSAHPAKSLRGTLHATKPLPSGPSTAVPLQAGHGSASALSGAAPFVPQSGIVSSAFPPGHVPASSRAGTMSDSLQRASAILPALAQVQGTGHEPAAENYAALTRREKNRNAAARSNERRKHALETLKLDLAKAEAKVLALTHQNNEAMNLNRQLKEEAARRWKLGASKT